jgi:type IV pilus assembly protein PilF
MIASVLEQDMRGLRRIEVPVVQPLRLAALALLVLFAAGCAQQPLRDAPSDGATGNLGSPLAQSSPADVYIELSAAYLQEEQFSEAFKNAKKAVIVDPRSSNAQYVLALVNQRLGQLEQAEEAYRKAVQLDPRNPAALNAYGSFLCDRQRYEDADGYFRRALQNPLYNTPWLALHNAGRCNEMAGDFVAAERDYRAALQINPRFGPSLLGMAQMSFRDENFLSARAYLQRYAEVAEHTAESLWLGIRTERQLGDQDLVATYSLKLKARFPDSEQAKYLQTIE